MSETGQGVDAAGRVHSSTVVPARRQDDGFTRMREEVWRGLSAPFRELPSKFFYDARGSELFEQITALPEYYLTRAERGLLEQRMPALLQRLGSRSLVELGAGSAVKSRIILNAMHANARARTYVPVDVSGDFLAEAARDLRLDYPALRVIPTAGDFTARLRLPEDLPSPVLVAFLGSTLGNFDRAAAAELLHGIASVMASEDSLLLGVDLRKNPRTIDAAYNDSRGVTAEFNRNILRAVNAALGADFDPGGFRHRAFYDMVHHRVEMHLVAEREMTVTIPGAGKTRFSPGESLRTEISTKYSRPLIEEILSAAGLELADWLTDADAGYALAVAVPSRD